MDCGDVLPKRTIRFSYALELPAGAGTLHLASADPYLQPRCNYNDLQDPWDRQRRREAIRLGLQLGAQRVY